jgi:hypothetical protein
MPSPSERPAGRSKTMASLVAAPIVSLIGFSLHPRVYDTGEHLLANIHAHSSHWNLSHGILFFDAMLWLLVVRTLVRVLAEHRPRAAMVGGLLGCIGSLAIAGITTGELVLAKVAAGTGGTPSPALAHQFDHGGTGLFVGPMSGLLVVGLIVLMVGLRRARIVPLVAVVAVIGGSLLFNFSGDVETIPIVMTGELIRLIGLAWLGARMVSGKGDLHDAVVVGLDSRQGSVLTGRPENGAVSMRCVLAVVALVSLTAGACSSRDHSTPAAGPAKYCELSQKLDQQSGPPTAKQMSELQEAAPEEIKADVKALLVEHKADAEQRLTSWEKANC